MCGGESHKKDYIEFINLYFTPGKYDSRGIYESLRCGLVHKFTIMGKKYGLTHNYPARHLRSTRDNQIVLNASSFGDDLWNAAQKYFDEVEADPQKLQKLIERFNKYGFLDLGKVSIKW
jgi:hypothetical protein